MEKTSYPSSFLHSGNFCGCLCFEKLSDILSSTPSWNHPDSFFYLQFFFGSLSKKETHPRWEYLVGFLAGFLGGCLSSNGPPIVIYGALQPWPKNTIKAIFVSFFFFCGIGIVISHVVNGLETPIVIRYFLIGIPFLILGTFLGHLCYQKISEVLYRKIIIYLLLLSGILTLYKAFV